jgi:predicted esterase
MVMFHDKINIMSKRKRHYKHKSFFFRHRILKYILLTILFLFIAVIAVIAIYEGRIYYHQSKIKAFYSTSGLPLKGPLGQVLRQEPLGVNVSNGKAYRILYRSQDANNQYTLSSGMVFIPNNSSYSSNRPVVAWAHGTLGLGDECAPSRTLNPVSSISWVNDMLAKGWVVTATDYAGFGTPGNNGYLVGGDEAHDVLNSVRAARNIKSADAGNKFVIWGHSQGGNSALFSASQVSSYAKELKLLGTVASAPAAELVPLLNEQNGTVADWVIGPLVGSSWPEANNKLNNQEIMTSTGLNNYKRIANQCILQSTLVGFIRQSMGLKFFEVNPISIPAWNEMATKQSAPILKPNQPLLIVESKTDKVVLPNTTSLYIQDSCKQKANLDTLWLDNVAHQNIPKTSSSQVIQWIGNRFNNLPNQNACSQPLPIPPVVN